MSNRELIEKALKKAGAILKKQYTQNNKTTQKKHRLDLVTQTDKEAEEIIVKIIQAKHPNHEILGEESGKHAGDKNHAWIIDPLDGTRNYSVHIPIFGVMISYLENDEVIEAGSYIPLLDQLMYAKKGEGAFLNGEQVKANAYNELSKSVGIVNSWTAGNEKLQHMQKIQANAKELMFITTGSHAANAIYLCSGRADWMMSEGAAVWDYAAISLILKEAGFEVSDKTGKPWTTTSNSMLVANKQLHKKLLGVIL